MVRWYFAIVCYTLSLLHFSCRLLLAGFHMCCSIVAIRDKFHEIPAPSFFILLLTFAISSFFDCFPWRFWISSFAHHFKYLFLLGQIYGSLLLSLYLSLFVCDFHVNWMLFDCIYVLRGFWCLEKKVLYYCKSKFLVLLLFTLLYCGTALPLPDTPTQQTTTNSSTCRHLPSAIRGSFGIVYIFR